ncbi:MAG TPA: hypothetical protein VE986_03880, partial [Hyphomicrobiales bacterium]|nr:hypothetical protein [Hyphomicrobiales bacterium]
MDKRSRIDARHALVPQKQTRAVTKPSSVQVKLGRLSEHGKFIADAIPGPVKAASRHSIVFCGRATAVLGAVIFLLIAGVYGRLLAGPISFASLVPTLQQHLNAQLRGYSFRIGDAILRLSAGWGLEFRLANVSLVDATGQEIAKAPFAAIDVSEAALLRLSLAASEISLLGPKILIFNHPAAGLTLTAPPEGGTPTAAGWKPANQPAQKLADTVRQTPASQKQILPFNLAPLLSRVFTALENRGGASSALHRIGMQEAVFYFASDAGVSSWRIADFHIDLEGGSGASALRGELTLQQDDAIWQASFRAVNKAQSKLYSLTASVKDVVPRIIWRSFPWIAPLKLADLPISGAAHFDISYGGEILGAEAEVQFGSGQVFAPFDEKHPAVIDGGL